MLVKFALWSPQRTGPPDHYHRRERSLSETWCYWDRVLALAVLYQCQALISIHRLCLLYYMLFLWSMSHI